MLSSSKNKRSRSSGESTVPASSHPSFGSGEVPSDILRCLKDTRLVDEQAMNDLLYIMHIRRLAAGDLIIKEGSLGHSVFILLQGTVVVSSEVTESEIGELGPGNVLGEIGGLLDVPRTMTIRAKGQGCTLGVLDREDIRKIPTLTAALLKLAEKRLLADEAREQQLLITCPSRKEHLDQLYTKVFGKKLSAPQGRYIKRAPRWILSLTSEAVRVHVLEGCVQIKEVNSGVSLGTHLYGEVFELEKSEHPRVLQAVGKTCIFYEPLGKETRTYDEAKMSKMNLQLHLESKDTFEAAIEQASRLSQIVASNTNRRSSIAVWSDESFLRPINNSQDSLTTAPKKRRNMSAPTMIDDAEPEDSVDIIGLLERMGVPAQLHRQTIVSDDGAGGIVLNLDPVHQFFDNELLEALLIHSGSSYTTISLHDAWTLSNECLAKIMTSCPKLKSLHLANCWSLTEAGFIAAFAVMPPGVQEIEVKSCAGLTDACLLPLARAKIKALDLSYCKNLGDGAWNYVKTLSASLESLTLRRCSRISGESILEALEGKVRFERMRSLDLTDCSFLSDQVICKIVEACPNLVSLNISFCQDLDVFFFHKLAKANPSSSIQELIVEHCQNFVTDETCTFIAKNWNNLSTFYARGCSLLTSDALKALATLSKLRNVDLSSCPKLDVNALTKAALVKSWTLAHPPIIFG